MKLEKLLISLGLKSKQKDWDSIPCLIEEALRTHAEYREIAQISVNHPRPALRGRTINRAVWDLPIRDGNVVTMPIDRTCYLNDENHVVYVSASKYYAVWWALREFDPRGICEVKKMSENRKYNGQDEIWAKSAKRPVPLADFSYDDGYGIGFIDRITRTLWLLYKGASSFPVRVHGEKPVRAMHAAIGDDRFQPITVQNLLTPSRTLFDLEYTSEGGTA